ncbi:hypothetical protein MMC28_009473 [Mycoblastus sanguinarius]|nr:hypothetical protein [Mycoblastus sanguinarius]
MRFRLGLLQDTAAIEKQIAKEAAEAQAKKHKHDIPTAKTEAQTKADEAAEAKSKDAGVKTKEQRKKPKIRPLTETKAIELGSNFASETFLLAVGVALILGENWRKGRQETSRREDVSDKIAELQDSEKAARKGLVELEKEVLRLRAKTTTERNTKRILPKEVWELEEKEEINDQSKGWLPWIKGFVRRDGAAAEPQPGPVQTPRDNPSTLHDDHSTTILSRIIPSSHAPESNPSPPSHPAQSTQRSSSAKPKSSDIDAVSKGS